MCGHCGCHEVEVITELRDEHVALTQAGDRVRRAMKVADRPAALAQLTTLVSWLTRHVEREEQGIFTALREHGEFADEVIALEGEHIALDTAVALLDPDRNDFDEMVSDLLTDLDVHIEREDLGIFPVSVVTLGATGWATVEHAHGAHPSFLPKGTTHEVNVSP